MTFLSALAVTNWPWISCEHWSVSSVWLVIAKQINLVWKIFNLTTFSDLCTNISCRNPTVDKCKDLNSLYHNIIHHMQNAIEDLNSSPLDEMRWDEMRMRCNNLTTWRCELWLCEVVSGFQQLFSPGHQCLVFLLKNYLLFIYAILLLLQG